MNPELARLFEEEYRVIRPRAPIPPIYVRFYRFTSLNTTIRLREGRILASLSDLLEGAPESVVTHTHEGAHFILVTGGDYVTAANGAAAPDRGALIYNPPGITHRDHFARGRAP